MGVMEPDENRDIIINIHPPVTREEIAGSAKAGLIFYLVLNIDYWDHVGIDRSRSATFMLNTAFDPGGEEWQLEQIGNVEHEVSNSLERNTKESI